MQKDRTILDLLDRLKLLLDFCDIEVVDYWDGDLCAIGLKKENRLVYISSYRYLHEKTPKYEYQLEIDEANHEPEFISEILSTDETRLINIIKDYLVIH